MLLIPAAAACSSSNEEPPLALIDATTSTQIEPMTSEAGERSSVSSTATTEAEVSTTQASSTTTADGVTTTTPAGAQSPAPNGGSGAPADVMSLYVGALGNYADDQPLAASPVAMPVVADGVSPLTGLATDRSATSAIVVKIDNSPKARPQAGLDVADVVIEQEVEGGITRFAAIFQSSAPERIGPVRSARSTDISFLSALGQPGLAYSGANEVFDTLILQRASVRNYSAYRFGGYWRDSSRPAPSNLYTGMSQFSTQGEAPPAWFHFGSTPPDVGVPVGSFVVPFPSTSITWSWNGVGWNRAQDGSDHTNESGEVLAAANVIVAQVAVVDSGLKDPTGAIVPEFVWAGEGPVSVFTNGRRIDGRWIRPTLNDPAVLVDAEGNIIELVPGATWVELTRSLP